MHWLKTFVSTASPEFFNTPLFVCFVYFGYELTKIRFLIPKYFLVNFWLWQLMEDIGNDFGCENWCEEQMIVSVVRTDANEVQVFFSYESWCHD